MEKLDRDRELGAQVNIIDTTANMLEVNELYERFMPDARKYFYAIRFV